MSAPSFVRAFVALPLPPELREALGRLIEQLRAGVPPKAVRWVRPDNLHLTLRFIGNLEVGNVDAVESALHMASHSMRPFRLRLNSLGCFPNWCSPKVLWIGIDGAMQSLHELQAKVHIATVKWGKLEEREFHPHLTLGRVVTNRKSALGSLVDAVERCSIPAGEPWTVLAVHLMQSVTTLGGAQYTKLAGVPLAA